VIPDDVSLLAFDDYPWTSLVEPGIDVLAQPVEAMGAEAVRILFNAMKGESREPEHARFAARLIARGSCAAPRS
jgi:LacI family transcriptional regulator